MKDITFSLIAIFFVSWVVGSLLTLAKRFKKDRQLSRNWKIVYITCLITMLSALAIMIIFQKYLF